MAFFQSISGLAGQEDLICSRSYGVVEMADGELAGLHFRPWPKLPSLIETWTAGAWTHRFCGGDRLWLYYNQPRYFPNYLALVYAVSNRETSYASLRRGFAVLDEIARIKESDAILCEAANPRINDRMMERVGFERHMEDSSHQHYIRRFYGEYPAAVG